MNGNGWRRVSRAEPCPVCGKPDWCLVSVDDTAVICPRVESDRRAGEAGWLHWLRPPKRRSRFQVRRFRVELSDPEADRTFARLARMAQFKMSAGRRAELARELGVSAAALLQLNVGWLPERQAFTWPMFDARGRVVGIHLRRIDGRKLAVSGSRLGLFGVAGLPEQLHRLVVVEGASDTAAALTLRLTAVGRPSCTAGQKEIAKLVRRLRPSEIVVIADADEAGLRGGWQLTRELSLLAPQVVLVVPVLEDLREWLCSSTRDSVRACLEELIERSVPFEPTLSLQKR